MIKRIIRFSAENRYLVVAATIVALVIAFWSMRNIPLDALPDLSGDERFLDRYWVSSTSGTTGRRGLFVCDAEEWTQVIASHARANEWAGVKADLRHHMRLAVVSSTTPWHQSARVGATVTSRFVPTLRIDASTPVAETVAKLNEFQPDNLTAYASMAAVLADEQIAGRLRIAPQAIMCASEVLTLDARGRIRAAWGREAFNVYVATETAGIAVEEVAAIPRTSVGKRPLIVAEWAKDQARFSVNPAEPRADELQFLHPAQTLRGATTPFTPFARSS